MAERRDFLSLCPDKVCKIVLFWREDLPFTMASTTVEDVRTVAGVERRSLSVVDVLAGVYGGEAPGRPGCER